MGIVDLHTHSTFSDGTDDPKSLIAKIEAAGLDGFALTDHETCDGIEPMRKALAETGSKLIFVPGIEYSTYLDGIGEIHILGYFPFGGIEKLDELIAGSKVYRMERAKRIVDCLKSKGVNLDSDKLFSDGDKTIGRMHIARALVEQGFFDDPQDAFKKYLGQGSPCYFPRRKLSPEDAIRVTADAGGISSLAHPVFLAKTGNWQIVDRFIDAGLQGIAYFHPRVTRNLMVKIRERYAGKLLLTGGSDFHGDMNQTALGFYGIPVEEFHSVFTTHS